MQKMKQKTTTKYEIYETAGIIREVMGGNMDTEAGRAEHPLLWEHNGFLGQNQNINNMYIYNTEYQNMK